VGERRTVVVAGAGIGGLTAALALSHAGYRVVVAERAPELSEAGAGIQLAPNAGRVLAALGLDAAIAAKAIEPTAIEVRSGPGGRILTSVPSAAFRDRYGFPYRVIHRADLQAVLAGAVAADPAIRLDLDTAVAEHHATDGGLFVRIRKRGNVEVVPAAALIGADGVWSTCRETIAASAAPAPSGRTAWRAVVSADVAHNLAALDRVTLWLGEDAHVVHYPVARGAALNVVAIVAEDWDKRGWSAVGNRAEIMRRFTGWAPALRRVVAAPLAWHKYAIVTVNPYGRWSDGRVALLGDAAHAMVPFLAQGAAMAIEDAAVLADRLHGATDIALALGEYEATRKSRVRRVAAAAEETGWRYHGAGIVALARDAALTIFGPRLILGRNNWLYGWRPPERIAQSISSESSSMISPR
jgi:salicylate hydroxylase